jgi:hypothetical protein
MKVRRWCRVGNSILICKRGGMRRHRMHSLQELEEVSEQCLPWTVEDTALEECDSNSETTLHLNCAELVI